MLTDEQLEQRLCSIDGCHKNYYGRNFCHQHYQRFMLYGDPLASDRRLKKSNCIIKDCNNLWKAKGYCPKHYQAFLKYGDPLFKSMARRPKKFTSLLENFESRFKKGDPEKCWEWLGTKDKDGYGEFSCWMSPGYKKFRATRFSYQLYIGDLKSDMLVCHSCDNPSCVNPRHFFIGTAQDNATDMIMKGRSMSGERNNKAKLTEEQAKIIKQSKRRTMELAREYKVSRSTILRIRQDQIWSHIC